MIIFKHYTYIYYFYKMSSLPMLTLRRDCRTKKKIKIITHYEVENHSVKVRLRN